MKYDDIFADVPLQEGSDAVDISCDEGMWFYISNLKKKSYIQWEYGTGKTVGQRQLRREITTAERVYIYGAGSSGGRTYKLLQKRGIHVEGFVDSSKEKQGTFYYDLRVWKPSEISPDSCVVVSGGKYTMMISNLLEREEADHITIFVDYANSLFQSKNPLEHEQLMDLLEE